MNDQTASAKALTPERLSALCYQLWMMQKAGAPLGQGVSALLEDVQKGLFAKARKNLEEHCFPAASLEEAMAIQEEHGGFIKTMWCGDAECEERMKDEAGMSSRCIPFAQEDLGDVCPICGRPAKKMIYWGVAY